MPADILLYALVAAGLVLWLRNILGTRHGDERQRPNPFSMEETKAERKPTDTPKRSGDQQPVAMFDIEVEEEPLPRNVEIDNKTAENGLEEISRAEKNFDLIHFVTGAQDAFALIVEAFAVGDREILKSLLAKNVYNAFDGAIKQRESNGQSVSTEIHAVRKAKILDAQVQNKMAFITIEFTADETCIVRDKDGEIVEGDPDRITEMVDIWTFGRQIKSKDPRWLVYETRDGEPEDHKTPVPDAS